MKTNKRAGKIAGKKKTRRRAKKVKGPNPAAVALGRLGGIARKKNLSPERASELGRLAAAARWPRRAAAVAAAAGTPADPPTV